MLLEHRLSWHQSICLIDLHRYFNVRISEFMSPPTLPETLMEPEASQPGWVRGDRRGALGEGRGGFVRLYVSLRSSPLILFFQTLLPWNEIDHSGELRSVRVFCCVCSMSYVMFICSFAAWLAIFMSSYRCFLHCLFRLAVSRTFTHHTCI